MPAGWVSAGVAALSYMSADDAQGQQSQGASNSDATQRYMYDTTRADNAPFLKTGTAANNRLSYLLGLSTDPGIPGYSGGTSSSGKGGYSLNDFTNYNTQITPSDYTLGERQRDAGIQYQLYQSGAYGDDAQTRKDFRNLLPELSSYSSDATYNGPDYGRNGEQGSLMRSFDATDLANDPIYQSTFQNALDNGNKAANQIGSASGSLLSGNTLKALSRFGANTAATYGNDAYNRFNTNQNNTYNRLAGISGTGQVASNTIGAAGQNAANQISASQQSLGNARGASSIAKANALSGGLNSLGNMYQQNYSQSLNQNNPYSNTGYSNSDIAGLQDYQGLY